MHTTSPVNFDHYMPGNGTRYTIALITVEANGFVIGNALIWANGPSWANAYIPLPREGHLSLGYFCEKLVGPALDGDYMSTVDMFALLDWLEANGNYEVERDATWSPHWLNT